MSALISSSSIERLSAEDVAAVFAALSQETRLEAYRLLVRYQPFGLAAGDISRLMAVPHNTLSTHMAILQTAGLVYSRREGRSIIFAAVPARFAATQSYLAQGVATGKGRAKATQPIYPTKRPDDHMSDKTYNVLVLCTGNSARSILAEAILNREGGGRFRAFSAGSQPKGKPNPVGLDLLTSLGYDTSEFRSKSWTEFAEAGAPKMDFIITVCDSAAGEACPYWPGHPLVAHWGIPDPADVAGTSKQKRAAFQEAYRRLMSRVTALVNLPIEKMGLSELKAQLAEIGKMDGATEMALAGNAA
jgi:ArsR family transcriptional regulator, arsenate/arsenite/antimonite-responsive transcriptional repressor / arsenate reductase (thioredoxin)